MDNVAVAEACHDLPALLERVQKDEQITLTTDEGVAVARLIPVEPVDDAARQRAIDELMEFGKGRRLPEGMTIRDLIDEGRRF